MHSLLRIARAGAAAALVVGLTGWVAERARYGPNNETALARVQDDLRDQLDARADRLGRLASRVDVTGDELRAAPRDPRTARALFDRVAAVLDDEETGRTGITVYAVGDTPIAWAGRVFDLPKERLEGPATLFVAAGAIGPRLVRVQPIVDRQGAAPRAPQPRIGTIVVEHSLAALQGSSGSPDTFVLSTSIVPVVVRPRVAGVPLRSPSIVVVSSRTAGLEVEADISPGLLAAARADWRRRTTAGVVAVFGLTLLLCAGPLIERRRRSSASGPLVRSTLWLATLVVGAFALLASSVRAITGSGTPTSPAGLLLVSLASLALVALAVDTIERRRVSRPRPRLSRDNGARLRSGGLYILAGAAAAAVLAGYELVLRRIVDNTTLDVLHFSLHPLGVTRIAVAFALVLLHASAIWSAVALIRAPALAVRARRSRTMSAIQAFGWLAGSAGILAFVARTDAAPPAPLAVAIAAAGICAVALTRADRALRRASQAARLGVLFAALVVPALAIYPSLFAYATASKERLVAGTYGPDVVSQREDLQRRVQQAIEQIDALPNLADFVAGNGDTPTVDRAFVVWSRTDLANYRLTSAIELYNAGGQLVSRFALHLPEYTATRTRAESCNWDELFDEVARFGSSERHVLRTSRGICERGRSVGTIVLRVMLDYRTLSFISTQSPYLESRRTERQVRPEGVSGRDIEFAMYGWSRAPMLESGRNVWTLTDRAFGRLTASREPFWTTLERDGSQFRVYFLSDRGAIYGLGYPVVTGPGHVINLAELALLAGVLYGVLLVGATLFGALTGRAASTGRQLLREVRSSFYRKLFLTYVAGAVVPVIVLAIAIRIYFVAQLTAGAEEAAQATVTTAQRLVEDYAAIQQAGAAASGPLDDQLMVLVWRAIDEDVNLFERTRLQATSARDLFASALLPTRTPGDVYRSILLDRAPTFIGDEKVGEVPYRLAAAPVRAGGRDGVVTVPLTNRQNEIEQQIDELDRRVRAATVLFILLGAALGYWMAERIADPVSRLTRATRRIARGDLDARIAATSSDELRRLVEDFNQMAADLQRQRVELERTQRLEAWADMARQVAHDIKNPLTPIQLSAEHARRVNLDRGQPLSPILDECIGSILSQVRLLRQIAAEFSSFGSSPTPRPERADVGQLVEEVVTPYRTGLAGRIAISVRTDPGAEAMVDRTLFARALTNVIENALHAMPGAGRLTISCRQRRPPDVSRPEIVVEVADTGVGMDDEALQRIFEPYFSTKAIGTGLGLTIAKRNIELNDGQVDVRSERGVGTAVTITLPAADA